MHFPVALFEHPLPPIMAAKYCSSCSESLAVVHAVGLGLLQACAAAHPATLMRVEHSGEDGPQSAVQELFLGAVHPDLHMNCSKTLLEFCHNLKQLVLVFYFICTPKSFPLSLKIVFNEVGHTSCLSLAIKNYHGLKSNLFLALSVLSSDYSSQFL